MFIKICFIYCVFKLENIEKRVHFLNIILYKFKYGSSAALALKISCDKYGEDSEATYWEMV